ncbi:orotate phosphoribosyltransferase [Thalassovita aquimarina]|uniref:Orotate phosphoribosyltransferase n=2 Tax=Thalassovita aquimarina TaxID=2785917 RepID=A0ABS5HSF0_9RHOB|nr:orotate phosphoribosyltransferase [Thalassovita aquimarina]MBR9651528.1 orotate phosphoribosyltransferase [Thalassovita aquimarina]
MKLHDFPSRDVIARMTAKMLLEINAVHFRADHPFTFTSGLASPVYIDCRKVISYPRVREAMMGFAGALLLNEIGFEQFDAVAGGETAGIPFAAWLAADLGLPMQYVRKKAKGFARDAQIEGDVAAGQRVLLVEDLTTDGGSKIKFCEALRRAGAVVDHTIMIFYYDIFPETRAKLKDHNLTLHALATWRDVLQVSKETNYFDTEALAEVERFLNEPLAWSGDHGGATSISL